MIAYVCSYTGVTKTLIIGGSKDIGKSKGISSVHDPHKGAGNLNRTYGPTSWYST